MIAHDGARAVRIALSTRGYETLGGRGEREHGIAGVSLLELRRDIERRPAISDRPEVNVVAARRLFTVVALAGAQVEEGRVGLEHRAHAAREAERGGEKDVGRCAPLDEVLCEVIAAGAPAAIEHPLGGSRT